MTRPNTRRYHALRANGHTQSQLSENGDPLQVPTNTSLRGRGQRQKGANMARPTANPPGESDIILSFSPL